MKTNPFLTAINPELDRQVRQTFEGQAHFAGTGPKGATCGNCRHWSGDQHSGSAICLEYWRRVRRAPPKKGFRVPRDAPACSAFVEGKQ